MEQTFPIRPQGNTDLELTQFGTEKCKPSHSFGPAIREYYLLHYIVSGKGEFLDAQSHPHTLSAGHGFLISPFECTYYQADSQDPWEYIWIGFIGRRVPQYLSYLGLNSKNPVFYDPLCQVYMNNMISAFEKRNPELLIIAELYRLISHLTLPDPDYDQGSQLHIEQVCDYIRNNINREIRIKDLAEELGYSSGYFSDLFKQKKGVSPKEYLMNCRMELACLLLRSGQYHIADISRSVGYDNPLFFSRIFKKKLGMSPREFRNRKDSN